MKTKSVKPRSPLIAFVIMAMMFMSFAVNAQRKVVGYIPNDGGYSPSIINFTRITHLNIAFENPDDAGNLSYNGGNDAFVTAAHNNGVKVLVSICGGGASENATYQARYTSLMSAANRSAFISKIVSYLNAHNLDGIDLDLEGPAINSNYNDFVPALKAALPAGKLLTAALTHTNGGNLLTSATAQTFDFLTVMAYDANWGQPLHHSTYDFAVTSANWWVTNKGMAPGKVILGVPFYGYTNTTGAGGISFASILNNYGAAAAQQDTWVSGGNTIYYNGIPTIRQKTQFVVDNNFGGVMIWQLAQDATGTNSLLYHIDQVIKAACTIPAQPGTISGNTSVSAGGSQTYSVAAVSGATSYTWTIPSGWSGSSTSASITTTVGSTGGTISVKANNACGSSAVRTLAVTVNCGVPAQPGAISGNTTVTAGSSNTYSITAVSGATSYTWALPSGWSGTSATSSISTTAGNAGGTISVTANNSCGASVARTLSVTVTTQPSSNLALNKTTVTSTVEAAGLEGNKAVDGSATTRWASAYADPSWIYVDLGASYSINRVKITWEAAYGRDYLVQVSPDASSWSTIKTVAGNTALSNDWTGLSGTGRYVRMYGTARGTAWGYSIYEFEVYGTSGCTLPTQPGTISGNTSVTSGSSNTYSVAAVSGATSYTWTLPSGWSGSSTTTSIVTTAGSAGGTISVKANNGCGSGTARTLTVTVGSSTSNLALGKAVTVSAVEPTTTFYGSNAVDGNATTTRWSSDYVDASWIYVDLGASYNVNRVKIVWEAAYGTAYRIQISSNASTWSDLKIISGNTTLVNDHTGLSGTGRYVRMLGTTRSSQWGYSIFEFEVYGSSAGRVVMEESVTDENDVIIFPNPVEHSISINAESFKNGQLKIMDVSGKEFISGTVNDEVIDASSLPSGFYILRLAKDKKYAVKKFVKK
jgi:hypothetical protein